MTLVVLFNDSPNGILNYRSVCVVNLPVGKPPKGLVLRSRYPQGNRNCDYAYQAVMRPYTLGLVYDDARTRYLNHGKLPCVLWVANSSCSQVLS